MIATFPFNKFIITHLRIPSLIEVNSFWYFLASSFSQFWLITDPVIEVTPPATPKAAPAAVRPRLAPAVKGAKISPAMLRTDPAIKVVWISKYL